MPRPLRHLSLTTTAGLQSFAELKRAVQGTLITGQRKVDQAKLETYWRTGALIDRHLALAQTSSSTTNCSQTVTPRGRTSIR